MLQSGQYQRRAVFAWKDDRVSSFEQVGGGQPRHLFAPLNLFFDASLFLYDATVKHWAAPAFLQLEKGRAMVGSDFKVMPSQSTVPELRGSISWVGAASGPSFAICLHVFLVNNPGT